MKTGRKELTDIIKGLSKVEKEDLFSVSAFNLIGGLSILSNSKSTDEKVNYIKVELNKINEDELYLINLSESIGIEHEAYQTLKEMSITTGNTRSSILATCFTLIRKYEESIQN